MFLKNYTSNVPVSQTIYRIEQVLIRCGVSGIGKDYGPGGKVIAITFKLPSPSHGRDMTVRLPADEKKALEALWLDYANGDKLSADGSELEWNSKKRKRRIDFADQAERTAWKIIQDWVEVQMSMIQLKQAEHLEVFMPYIWDGETTVYGRLKESGFRALLPEKSEAA